MNEYSFPRYLAAKKSVDDRALNRPVLETLVKSLPTASPGSPLQVLELGAGIGTMLERLLEWDILQHTSYLGIDAEGGNIAAAYQRLPTWASGHGFEVVQPDGLASGSTRNAPLHLSRLDQTADVRFAHLDLFDLLKDPAHTGIYDLLIAHAFLDLIDLPSALPAILRLLKPGGLFYFTLNFDGETIFEPTPDREREAAIIGAYHHSMDARNAGDSRTGRRMFSQITQAGGRILNAGASDWVVFPLDGAYPGDEAYFLRHILYFFQESLGSSLPDQTLQPWLALRQSQIDHAELIYVAHQIDFVGQFPASGSTTL